MQARSRLTRQNDAPLTLRCQEFLYSMALPLTIIVAGQRGATGPCEVPGSALPRAAYGFGQPELRLWPALTNALTPAVNVSRSYPRAGVRESGRSGGRFT